jgi:hypothetical protein
MLRGFVTVPLTPGLIIHDLPVHRSGESLTLMPGTPLFDKDGRVLTTSTARRSTTLLVRRDPEALQ